MSGVGPQQPPRSAGGQLRAQPSYVDTNGPRSPASAPPPRRLGVAEGGGFGLTWTIRSSQSPSSRAGAGDRVRAVDDVPVGGVRRVDEGDRVTQRGPVRHPAVGLDREADQDRDPAARAARTTPMPSSAPVSVYAATASAPASANAATWRRGSPPPRPGRPAPPRRSRRRVARSRRGAARPRCRSRSSAGREERDRRPVDAVERRRRHSRPGLPVGVGAPGRRLEAQPGAGATAMAAYPSSVTQQLSAAFVLDQREGATRAGRRRR